MAWNRRSRAAVDETNPDAHPGVEEPDGTVDTGRTTPVADTDTVADGSAPDRTALDEPAGERVMTGGGRPVDYGAMASQREAERQAAESEAEREAAERGAADQAALDRDEDVTDRHPVVDPGTGEVGDRDVVTEPEPVAVTPRVRARGSLVTTIGLILSVVALCASLTGLLAPEGLVLGIVGVLISMGGVRAARRDGVTGSATAVLSVLIGLFGVVIAVLAMTGDFTWPNSRTDQIQVWHDWLVAHWSTLDRW